MSTKRGSGRIVLIVVALVVFAYAVATMWFVVREDKLLLAPVSKTLSPIPYSDVDWKRVEIITEDTVRLVGWEIAAEDTDSSNVWLIYFYDRDQTVSDNIEQYLNLRNMGVNILVVDYRGFGESEGESSEENLYTDAKTIYDQVRYKKGIDSRNIILYGVSLGAAVAVDLAVRVNAAAVVVVSGYNSAPDLLQSWYPYMPLKPFLSNELSSIDKIPQINTPKFFVYASAGSCTPREHSRDLYDAAGVKYRTYLEPAGESVAQFDHTYYTCLADSLTAKAWLPLKSPRLPAGDTLAAIVLHRSVEEAIRWYRELQQNQADVYDFSEFQLDRLGQHLLEDGKAQEAREIFSLNVSVFPKSYHAYYILGKALIEVGDEQTAAKNLRKSLDLKPGYPEAVELIRKLEKR